MRGPTQCLLLLTVAPALGAPVRVDLPGGSYILARPGSVPETAPAPLIFCLHATEEDAAKAAALWQAAQGDLAYTVVAPQCPSGDWTEAQADFVNAVFAHVGRTVDYDPRRVLLVGHGAGATLATQLFYGQNFPAVALALHGGGMSPTVGMPQLVARLDRQVLWTIGDSDPSATSAATGAERLRVAGLPVELRRGPAGAAPTPAVVDLAARWFEARCGDAVARFGKEALATNLAREPVADILMTIDEMSAAPNLASPSQLELLSRTRGDLENPVRQVFLKAEREIRENNPLEARKLLLDMERRFLPTSLGIEALHRRERLESSGSLARMLKPGARAADINRAAILWMKVESAQRRGRLPEAYRIARRMLADEPLAVETDKAEQLLLEIDPNLPRRPPRPTPTPYPTPPPDEPPPADAAPAPTAAAASASPSPAASATPSPSAPP